MLAAKETVLSKTISAVLCCPPSCSVVPSTSQPQSWRSTAVLRVRSWHCQAPVSTQLEPVPVAV